MVGGGASLSIHPDQIQNPAKGEVAEEADLLGVQVSYAPGAEGEIKDLRVW